MSLATISANPPAGRGWSIGLWVAQLVLAGFYAMAGWMHAFLSPDALVQMGVAWAADAPVWLIRFIGLAELAGVAGLVLPGATRIYPALTQLAAAGLAAIQVLAIPFHLSRGELGALPFNLVLLGLAVLIVWGRERKAPIAARS